MTRIEMKKSHTIYGTLQTTIDVIIRLLRCHIGIHTIARQFSPTSALLQVYVELIIHYAYVDIFWCGYYIESMR